VRTLLSGAPLSEGLLSGGPHERVFLSGAPLSSYTFRWDPSWRSPIQEKGSFRVGINLCGGPLWGGPLLVGAPWGVAPLEWKPL
jgi:hypothetical protein